MRAIGVVAHGYSKLVLPSRVANIQAIVVPFYGNQTLRTIASCYRDLDCTPPRGLDVADADEECKDATPNDFRPMHCYHFSGSSGRPGVLASVASSIRLAPTSGRALDRTRRDCHACSGELTGHLEGHAHRRRQSTFQLFKTFIFKPKTSKSAVTGPVIINIHEEMETNSGALGKS